MVLMDDGVVRHTKMMFLGVYTPKFSKQRLKNWEGRKSKGARPFLLKIGGSSPSPFSGSVGIVILTKKSSIFFFGNVQN